MVTVPHHKSGLLPHEMVASCVVTAEQLTALGFPVRETVKCVGSTSVTRPGMTFEAACHAAWAAGLVRLETRVFEAKPPPRMPAEVAEWLGLELAAAA